MGGHLGIRAVEHRKIQIGSHKIRYVIFQLNFTTGSLHKLYWLDNVVRCLSGQLILTLERLTIPSKKRSLFWALWA